MLRSRFGIVAVLVTALAPASPGRAGEAVALKAFTIHPAGVRPGPTGERFFYVEGKTNGENGKYASFAVLEFPAAGLDGEGTLTLTLTQSIARFSVDGPIKFYLATADLDVKGFKFDPSGLDGLGGQVPSKAAIGSGSFKKAETGKADTFTLTLDDAARDYVKARAAKGEPIRIVVVPEDEKVAATYFGAGADEAARKPKLTAGKAP